LWPNHVQRSPALFNQYHFFPVRNCTHSPSLDLRNTAASIQSLFASGAAYHQLAGQSHTYRYRTRQTHRLAQPGRLLANGAGVSSIVGTRAQRATTPCTKRASHSVDSLADDAEVDVQPDFMDHLDTGYLVMGKSTCTRHAGIANLDRAPA